MREKGEILSESSDGEAEAPKWQLASLYQERLKLEVLIDIRDILDERLISLDNTILKYVIPK